MKKESFLPLIRGMGIVLMFLLSLIVKAQTPNTAVLTWDQQVGCIRYEDEVKDDKGDGENYAPSTSVNLLEGMMDGQCIRFCEYSYVTYTLQGNNIANVQWQVSGGTVNSGNNTNAYVSWGAFGGGSLTISITYTDNTVVTRTICIEKITRPDARFEIDGPDPYQQKFCVGTPISFNNLSTENNGSAIVNYLWNFGDGTYSNAFEPTHTYTSSGGYNITLTVTNSCNCTATYEFYVDIEDATPIEISCLNVTCEYRQETYNANDGCGGDWEVIGGSIVGGGSGNSYVDIIWDQVDPADGFGYISYRSYCYCPHWNTVKIPVIVHNAILQGPNIICQGKQAKYTLPQWPTTEFDWRINGDPNHPMIVYTDQRNEIMVDGLAPGTYYLDVDYRNTLLGKDDCAGRIERFVIEVVENIAVVSPDPTTVCTGVTNRFDSSNGQPVAWEVKLGNTVVHTDFNSSTIYTFNVGGTYVITANNNGCISDAFVVNVIPTPVITGSISGPDKVCLNVPYTYTVNENDPGAIYVWSATGGTIIGSNAGTEVAAVFTSSTGTVSVVKQYVKNGVICSSDPVSYNVSELQLNPIITNNSGLTQFCPSDKYTFTANLNGVQVDHLEWEIVGIQSPGSYTTNFGSIINGMNDLTVEVGLNEISNNVSNGELRLKVTKCNKTVTVTVPINLVLKPTYTVGNLGSICPGAIIALDLTSSTGSGQVYVNFGFGNTGPHNFTNGTPLQITNGFTNTGTSSITQNLTVEFVGTCKYNTKISQSVIVYPETTVEITPQYTYIVCLASGYSPITLTANLYAGIGAPATFQWVKDGVNIPSATSSSYVISTATQPTTPVGVYHVRVTNSFGCVVISDPIEVIESCGGTPVGCNAPSVNLSASWSACNDISASITTGGSYNSITWYGSSHLTLTSGQGTPYAVFQTEVPGTHTVIVHVDFGGCVVIKTIEVTKNYEADLKTNVTCNPDGTFNVELLNHSKLYQITQSAINFGYSGPGVASGANGQSYTVTGLNAGTYTYTLTLTSPGKPTCIATATIVLEPAPNVNFSIPVANSEYCSDQPVPLTLPNVMVSGYRYEWHFDGTHYVASNNVTPVQFSTAGSKNISLIIITPNGCIYETNTTIPIKINKAEFDGSVSPTPLDFCEGSTVTPLSFSPFTGFSSPVDAIWMRDNVQVAPSGLTYTPTQSGSYWPILIDGNGCKFYGMAEKAAIVTMRKPPFASINGNTNVCYGESTTLTGIYTDPNVEHRWTLNGNALPGTMGSWTAGTGNLSLNLSGLTPGTYAYAFETRLPNDPSCTNSFEAVVVFHPQLATPYINYNVVDCQPYTLELTANGPANGTYVWSNGMVGQTIYVNHGGAYSVTYTAPTGCSITTQVQTPHNPERTLWIVPQGCYKICASLGAYLLAPYGFYEGYQWMVNGGITQMGNNTFIPNQLVNQSGTYQLSITQNMCTFYSAKPQIDLDYGCRTANKTSANSTETVVPTFKLSPNPTSEVTLATFDMGEKAIEATSITVHDVKGVQHLQESVTGTKGETVLNVHHLAPGTYMVNLHANGTVVAQQKLIKK